jgi:hypothetical protein
MDCTVCILGPPWSNWQSAGHLLMAGSGEGVEPCLNRTASCCWWTCREMTAAADIDVMVSGGSKSCLCAKQGGKCPQLPFHQLQLARCHIPQIRHNPRLRLCHMLLPEPHPSHRRVHALQQHMRASPFHSPHLRQHTSALCCTMLWCPLLLPEVLRIADGLKRGRNARMNKTGRTKECRWRRSKLLTMLVPMRYHILVAGAVLTARAAHRGQPAVTR